MNELCLDYTETFRIPEKWAVTVKKQKTSS